MERLIIYEEGEKSIFHLTSRVAEIGRGSKNDIVVKDRNASRKHCNIIQVGDSWFAVDCESQNGTFVNGEQIKKKELKDGDRISVGSTIIILRLKQEEVLEEEDCKTAPQKPCEEEKPTRPEGEAKLGEEPKPDKESKPDKEAKKKETPSEQSLPTNKAPRLTTLSMYYQSFKEDCQNKIVGNEQAIRLLFVSLVAGENAILCGEFGVGKYTLLQTIAQVCELSFQRFSLLDYPLSGFESKYTAFPNLRSINLINNFKDASRREQLSFLAYIIRMKDRYEELEGNKTFSVFLTHHPVEPDNIIPIEYTDLFLLQIPIVSEGLQREQQIAERTLYPPEKTESKCPPLDREMANFQKLLQEVNISEELFQKTASLTYFSRPGQGDNYIDSHIQYGASPRTGPHLLKAARIWASLKERNHVTAEDIETLAPFVLSHRIILSENASSEGTTIEEVISYLLEKSFG